MAIRFNFVCLLLLSAVVTVTSLKCYSCDSTTDGDKCADPPDLTEADTKYTTVCLKNSACKKSEIEDGDKISVVRSCSSFGHNTTCIEEVVGDRTTYICYCNTDYCNGSDVSRRPSLTSVLCVLIGLWFSKLLLV